MNKKSDVKNLFTNFYNMIENQFQTKIGILHSDNGTEYFNEHLGEFLEKKKGFFINLHVEIPLNKMALQNEKINTYSK